jgi:hypothetical protein
MRLPRVRFTVRRLMVAIALSTVLNVSTRHQPIGKTLEEILGQLGMAYSVRNGLLTITSKESLDMPFQVAPIP